MFTLCLFPKMMIKQQSWVSISNDWDLVVFANCCCFKAQNSLCVSQIESNSWSLEVYELLVCSGGGETISLKLYVKDKQNRFAILRMVKIEMSVAFNHFT